MILNILVVDDSAVMRSIIKKTLRLSGLPLGELYEASEGREGLEILDNHRIDLALVDLNMPYINGEEMIRRVRRNPETEGLPILVVSTESSETRIDRIQGMGVAFIHKPFTPERLRNAVQKLAGVLDGQDNGADTLRYGGPDF